MLQVLHRVLLVERLDARTHVDALAQRGFIVDRGFQLRKPHEQKRHEAPVFVLEVEQATDLGEGFAIEQVRVVEHQYRMTPFFAHHRELFVNLCEQSLTVGVCVLDAHHPGVAIEYGGRCGRTRHHEHELRIEHFFFEAFEQTTGEQRLPGAPFARQHTEAFALTQAAVDAALRCRMRNAVKIKA